MYGRARGPYDGPRSFVSSIPGPPTLIEGWNDEKAKLYGYPTKKSAAWVRYIESLPPSTQHWLNCFDSKAQTLDDINKPKEIDDEESDMWNFEVDEVLDQNHKVVMKETLDEPMKKKRRGAYDGPRSFADLIPGPPTQIEGFNFEKAKLYNYPTEKSAVWIRYMESLPLPLQHWLKCLSSKAQTLEDINQPQDSDVEESESWNFEVEEVIGQDASFVPNANQHVGIPKIHVILNKQGAGYNHTCHGIASSSSAGFQPKSDEAEAKILRGPHEDEFKQLLLSYSKTVEPDRLYECLPNSLRPSSGSPDSRKPSNSHEGHITAEASVFTSLILIPPCVLPLLYDLAQHMVLAGHTQQCVAIYRDTRSTVLEETLQKLGVEKLSIDDVQKMQWEVLQSKIGTWIRTMRIAVKLLFTAERKVCDQMFEGIDSLKDQCFAEVTTGCVAMLLSFGDAIVKIRRSPEKLFVLLDMYGIMRELHSEIESLFRGESCKDIRESALGFTKRLAQTVQETLWDFEEAVEKDATKTAVSDGTVHPLTSYVINCVNFLFDYQSMLKQLFQEFENGEDLNSQLASVTMRIMQALQINLEGKSKQYEDPALTNLFLMNNIHYMVRSVRSRSEAKDLLGDDWLHRHIRVVQQHANQYEKIAWAKILQCLLIQGLSSFGEGGSVGGDGGGNSSGVSRALVKDRLKIFNGQFEKLHQRQSQWTIPDTDLRESLWLAVAEVLLPAYRSFIKRFGALVENGKNPHKYIKYTAQDLDWMLGDIFEGKALNKVRR